MRIGLVRIVLVAFAVGMVAIACGSQEVDTSATPGITDEDRAVDRSPFEMAGPNDASGSTTIPGVGPTLVVPTSVDPATGEVAVLGQLPPSAGGPDPFTAQPPGGPSTPFTLPKPTTTTTTTAPTTTVPPPAPTTTTIPLFPLPPPGPNSSTICGFTVYFQSLSSLVNNPDLDRVATVAGIRSALQVYGQIIPAQLTDDWPIIASEIGNLVDSLERVGYNVADATWSARVRALLQNSAGNEAFLKAFDRFAFYERVTCPR